ncbi:Oidioi.mRNA.OKI2018_I69.PAR.g12677.t1.cds [Oikopleura dioica]|uniref:XK-related protein n=1 Tax=Oikopleura dioica TaxID=34765 RepID=A0ABN7S1P8_OIKDI|nr:Oidioi.mRNA.OKI2018_I69.PAR.g12677.t1.cds [Oikopleura dioica]
MARHTVFKTNPCEALGQIFSALSYIGDISTDIVVAYFYFTNDHFYWGIITLLLVLVPGWIVAFFSLYWLVEDQRKPSPMVIFLHIICCGPLWRYWQAFNALRYQRPTFTGTFSEALSDVSMLRLIEGILESAPQLMLQMYIIISKTGDDEDKTLVAALVSATFSMVSISWGMASYARALRKAAPETTGQMTKKGVFFYFLWRFFEFTSRILTLVLFAYAYKLFVLVPIFTHWLFMIIWQIYLGANFHDTQNSCVEGFFQMVMAFLQVFLFFHLCEGPSRENMCKYYILVLLENAVMLCLWYPKAGQLSQTHGKNFNELLITIIVASFILALLFCVFYYVVWHPKAKIKKMASKSKLKEKGKRRKEESVSMIEIDGRSRQLTSETEYPTLRRKMQTKFGLQTLERNPHLQNPMNPVPLKKSKKTVPNLSIVRESENRSSIVSSAASSKSSTNWNRPSKQSLKSYNSKSKTKYNTMTRD